MTDQTPTVEEIAGRLLELAKRCEAATGPDTQLDVVIACTLHGWVQAEGRPWLFYDPADKWKRSRKANPYTASLDAAMTLVPEDHTVQLSDWDATILREKGAWQAIILPMGARGNMTQYTFTNRCDHAATLALAICAAALRARATLIPKEPE